MTITTYNWLDGTLNGWIVESATWTIDSTKFGHDAIQCSGHLDKDIILYFILTHIKYRILGI